ncbi:MAG TPA: AAA family ATPase [Reyranella sp.]|jgi:predicted ATPase
MKRFILTGTPGSGKTVILRQLEVAGYGVVEEAATDVIALQQAAGIAEPWTRPAFIDDVVALQARRRTRLVDSVQFHDRSAFCTAALADYLGYPPSDILTRELEVLKREAFYEKRVFFVQSLGFVTPSAARRITLEEARRFEEMHEKTYRLHGFELIPISPGSVLDRVAAILGRD